MPLLYLESDGNYPPKQRRAEINIEPHRKENEDCISSTEEIKIEECKSTAYVLSVSDNGIGFLKTLRLKILIALECNW